MPGYSGTPLPQKLGIKPGAHVVLVDAPVNFEAELQPLPEGVNLVFKSGAGFQPAGGQDVRPTSLEGKAAVVLAFYTQRAAFDSAFKDLAAGLQPAGGLWIAWPKKSSGVPTDLNEHLIREIGLAAGLVDNKVCAV